MTEVEPRAHEALPDDDAAVPEAVAEEEPRAGEALPDEEITVVKTQANGEAGIDEAVPKEGTIVRQALAGKEPMTMESLVEAVPPEAVMETAAMKALVNAAETASNPVALGADGQEPGVRHRPIEEAGRFEDRERAGLARAASPG